MSETTRDSTSARKKRPAQTGEMIATRVQPNMLRLIDDWRREQPDLPSRPEALRRLALKGLMDGSAGG
jgi:hypothetical protein